jgi:hypothetical protein
MIGPAEKNRDTLFQFKRATTPKNLPFALFSVHTTPKKLHVGLFSV